LFGFAIGLQILIAAVAMWGYGFDKMRCSSQQEQSESFCSEDEILNMTPVGVRLSSREIYLGDDEQRATPWRTAALTASIVLLGLSAFVYHTSAFGHKASNLARDKHEAPKPHAHSAVAILQSRELQNIISDGVVHLAKTAASRELHSALNGTAVADSRSFMQPRLSAVEEQNLRSQTQHKFKETLRMFYSEHPEAASTLAAVNVSTEQMIDIMTLLNSFTDVRLLHVGMRAGAACAGKAETTENLELCMRGKLEAHQPQLQQLRNELLPQRFQQGMGATIFKHHLKLLKQNTLKASTNVAGWQAELRVTARSLQSWEWPASGPYPHPQGITPLNWFTVGAPVVSNMVGLLFLSLMSLLPGESGFWYNRMANYAMWGIQGAATIGDCLANIGFPKVVYFASCIISAMYWGMESIWAFADGKHVADAPRKLNCDSYNLWPTLEGVCGNCVGIVRSSFKSQSCESYCSSFGHSSTFAAVPVPNSCYPKGRYKTTEVIPFDRFLCQCCTDSVRQIDQIVATTSTTTTSTTTFTTTATLGFVIPPIKLAQTSGPQIPITDQCIHDEPYTFMIEASTQTGSSNNIPRFTLKLEGKYLGGRSGFAFSQTFFSANQSRLSRSLILPKRPDIFSLYAVGPNQVGYRQILMIRGAETTVILNSSNGLPLGENDFWVSTVPPARRFNRFIIPPMGTLSNFTNFTINRSRPSSFIGVEAVTSSQEGAETSGSLSVQVDVLFQFPTGNSTISASKFGPLTQINQFVMTGECVTYVFDSSGSQGEITQLRLRASGGNSSDWGYSRIAVVTSNGTTILLDSFNGLPRGDNDFWIGATGALGVRTNQSFPFVNVTKTTTTTTTTTITATAFTGDCSSFTSWPSILGVVCGNCAALVEAAPYGRRCDTYCQSFSQECVQAAASDGTCEATARVPCSTPVPGNSTGMLCTCSGSLARNPDCANYNEWPAIEARICGSCTATVPVNHPSEPYGKSCSDFCSNFGHECSSANQVGTRACISTKTLSCSDVVEGTEALCQCRIR